MNVDDAVALLAALAHPTRLQAFRLLVAASPDGLPAGSVATQVDVPPSTLSSHLARLEQSGLVRADRAGRQIIYRVEADSMRRLLDFLIGDCCAGRPELCGFTTAPGSDRPVATDAKHTEPCR